MTGTTGSLLLGVGVLGLGVPAAGTATAAPATITATSTATAQAAPVTIHTQQVAAKKKRKVDVKKEMKTAAAQKGKPYRYGAAGPHAFDCSGFTSYVLKKQGVKLPRTAAQQYSKTKRVSAMKAKVGIRASGMAAAVIAVARQLRRKANTTSAASTMPSSRT